MDRINYKIKNEVIMAKGGAHFKGKKDINVPDFNPEWIKSGIKGGAINYAERLGEKLNEEGFSSSQIRNFYGELKRIQLKGISENISSFHLLHPKLAYAAKRAETKRNKGPMIFKEEIIKAHRAVNIDKEGYEKRFQNFCDLCEAILAFHKAFGGKD